MRRASYKIVFVPLEKKPMHNTSNQKFTLNIPTQKKKEPEGNLINNYGFASTTHDPQGGKSLPAFNSGKKYRILCQGGDDRFKFRILFVMSANTLKINSFKNIWQFLSCLPD